MRDPHKTIETIIASDSRLVEPRHTENHWVITLADGWFYEGERYVYASRIAELRKRINNNLVECSE